MQAAGTAPLNHAVSLSIPGYVYTYAKPGGFLGQNCV